VAPGAHHAGHINCGPCGAEIEEQDTGLWETGGDTAGQRRHCTESKDHLHHPGAADLPVDAREAGELTSARAPEPGESGGLVGLADYLEEGAADYDAGGAVDLPGRVRLVAGKLRELLPLEMAGR
jgi:hypothetical protein